MNFLSKAGCRIFQAIFHLALPILPYRTPEKISHVEDIPQLLQSKNLYSVLLVTDAFLRSAGAPDQYGKHFIHPHYINAGVLLFNMKRCRETGLFEKARELIRVKKLPFADQSALARSATKRMVLAQKYNVQHTMRGDTVIRHFAKRMFWTPYPHTENIKQWQVDQVHKKFGYTCFDDIYEEYLAIKEEMQ